MCGIIGILSEKPVVPLLVQALKRLEYRGYDSAGVATLLNGGIERRRAEGKLDKVVAHLMAPDLNLNTPPQEAGQAPLSRLDGAFALATISAGQENLLIGARRGRPLAIGYGEGEKFPGSAALALAPLNRRLSFLEE